MQSLKIIITAGLCLPFIGNGCAQRRTPSTAPWQNNYKFDRPAGAVVRALRAGQEQRLLVVLKHDNETMGLADAVLTSETEEAIATRAARYNELKQSVISSVQSKNIKSEDVYSHLPIFKVSVKSLNELLAVANDQSVSSISEDVQFFYKNTANLNLIRHPEAMQTGYNGANTSVAVLDTGLDYKRSAFGSCTAPSTPAATCRVVHVQDFARSDNTLDDSSLHGTNVSGIVGMVAPATKLIGLDVFDGEGAYTSDIVNAINWVIANKTKYNIAAMNMSFGSSGFNNCSSGSMAVAINSARQAGILSAVASGNSGTTFLDYPACAPSALAVGAVYDSNIGTVDWGCGVKDVSAPDKITCFSNTSVDLKIAAPGVRIVSAGITMTGTSQATPHVAGAIAVLKSASPNDTPDQIQEKLIRSGKPITLPSFPTAKTVRLDLASALGPQCQYVIPQELKTLDPTVNVDFTTGSSCKWTIASEASWIKITSAATGQGSSKISISLDKPLTAERSGMISITGDGSKASLKVIQPPDTESPTGSFVINGTIGAGYTTSRDVTIELDVKDISEIESMCVSNTSSCSQFVPFQQSVSWQLSEGDGVKTVYVFLKDKLGNTTKPEQPLSKSIILDTTPPQVGTLSGKVSTTLSQTAELSWTGFSDSQSPISSYIVVVSDAAAPSSCSSGTQIFSGSATTTTHGPINPGTYHYRVCARNAAQLTSEGAATSITITELDKNPPTGSVVINRNAPFTTSRNATLTITATDPSGVSKMCVSATNSCTTWENFATTKSVTLSWTQGLKSIFVWFEDSKGNRSTTPVKDDISLDTIAPTTGRLVAQALQQAAKLSWTTGSDSSGIASYRLVYRQGTVAPRGNCVDGTSVLLTPGFLEATVTNLLSRTFYAFRVCAVDRAGNVGFGSTIFVRPL